MSTPVPVIAIDGPTASGKGTVAAQVADRLGFHYLDSGALYRLVALKAMREGIDLANAGQLATAAATLRPVFAAGRIEFDGADATQAIRAEEISRAASQVAVHAPVRQALSELQRRARRAPGLVADGRDMGTVVFPDASLKVYLTAALESRAERRHKQLIEKGFPSNITTLLQELCVRDKRDSERAAAPLRPAKDAYLLDSSQLTVDQVVAQVLDWYASKNAPTVK